MEEKKDTKKTISQWIGVIISLMSAPMLYLISLTASQAMLGDTGLGFFGTFIILGIVIYLFALLISKITYFIIK